MLAMPGRDDHPPARGQVQLRRGEGLAPVGLAEPQRAVAQLVELGHGLLRLPTGSASRAPVQMPVVPSVSVMRSSCTGRFLRQPPGHDSGGPIPVTPGGSDMVKKVSNVWLPVEDMQRALGFYRDTLGLTVEMESPEWSELDASGSASGSTPRSPRREGRRRRRHHLPRRRHRCRSTPRCRARACSSPARSSSYEWGKVAPFKDSEGNDLQLYAAPE
jgi:predicted enzyme related to lactoylglutathione lyase